MPARYFICRSKRHGIRQVDLFDLTYSIKPIGRNPQDKKSASKTGTAWRKRRTDITHRTAGCKFWHVACGKLQSLNVRGIDQ
jgi:hypothetical protein